MAGSALLNYRVALRAHGLRPGAHASSATGPGLAPAASLPLARARDWRRLDLPTTLRDPLAQLWVRQFQQRSALRVWLLADVSASMARWRAPLCALAEALAQSALQQGDAFGLVTFGDPARAGLCLPPSRARQAVAAALHTWGTQSWQGAGLQGQAALGTVAAQLQGAPGLVVLASDFLAPAPAWAPGLAALARHDVLPLWLDEPGELASLPRWGLAQVQDSETRRQRLLWLRPALAQRWQARAAAHRAAVQALLRQQQRVPVRLGRQFQADAINRQLAQRVA